MSERFPTLTKLADELLQVEKLEHEVDVAMASGSEASLIIRGLLMANGERMVIPDHIWEELQSRQGDDPTWFPYVKGRCADGVVIATSSNAAAEPMPCPPVGSAADLGVLFNPKLREKPDGPADPA